MTGGLKGAFLQSQLLESLRTQSQQRFFQNQLGTGWFVKLKLKAESLNYKKPAYFYFGTELNQSSDYTSSIQDGPVCTSTSQIFQWITAVFCWDFAGLSFVFNGYA